MYCAVCWSKKIHTCPSSARGCCGRRSGPGLVFQLADLRAEVIETLLLSVVELMLRHVLLQTVKVVDMLAGKQIELARQHRRLAQLTSLLAIHEAISVPASSAPSHQPPKPRHHQLPTNNNAIKTHL
jgi:hypothetical protein